MQLRPKVGLGVFILKGNSILMGYRKDNWLLALPGGHVEGFEEFEECAIREVQEEIGINIENPKLFTVASAIRKEIQHHYVVIFMKALYDGIQEVKNLEPDKHSEWFWVDKVNFEQHYKEQKLFYGLMKLVEIYGTVENLYEKIILL